MNHLGEKKEYSQLEIAPIKCLGFDTIWKDTYQHP